MDRDYITNTATSNASRDWRPEFLARRHRISRRHARLYLDWSLDRWEVKA